MDRALCGLSSEDDIEVLATLGGIMRGCERLEASLELRDHDRFLFDLVERLVIALRARLDLPGAVVRLH